jgi:predicted TIM-barrel fold metal-dependent hydrolase
MIIDFHTHVFPDKIAKRTIDLLSEMGSISPSSDGTVSGLIEKMEAAGIDISVTLPVLTNPSQFDSVNRFALELNEKYKTGKRRIISFAGIHPHCDGIGEKMAFIKKSGFLGIKIHPDYQDTFFDDERYVEILNYAKEYDLIAVTHAGVDIAFRNCVHCTPERALSVIKRVGHKKLVLAHLGGSELPEEVIDKLCGEDVYFDTAYILRYINEEAFKKILNRHGADRILFATDYPWSSIEEDVKAIKSFSLDRTTEEKLFEKNARELLGI